MRTIMALATASLIAAIAAPAALAQQSQVAAETGGHAADYLDAVTTPATDQTCEVLLSVVLAGSLKPVTDGFQLAIDQQIDVNGPRADYHIGLGSDGRASFAGGGLREMTDDFKDGVLTLPGPPKYFDVELSFGPGAGASAVIQRQCLGPQTRLIYVIDNPDTGVKGGDWLWVKPSR
jgi:hypothetical protein